MKHAMFSVRKTAVPFLLGAVLYYVFFWQHLSTGAFITIVTSTFVLMFLVILLTSVKMNVSYAETISGYHQPESTDDQRYLIKGNQRIAVYLKRVSGNIQMLNQGGSTTIIGFQASSSPIDNIGKETQSGSSKTVFPYDESVNDSDDIIVNFDEYGVVKFASNGMLDSFGIKPDNIIGRNIMSLTHVFGSRNREVLKEIHQDYHTQDVIELEYCGQKRWFLWSYEAVLDRRGDVDFILGNGHDITKFVEANGATAYDGKYDCLTGLLSQQGLYENIGKLENISQAVSFFIDIKSFSKINDYYGHNVGDDVLVEIAKGLDQFSAQNVYVSRFSGDKFVLFGFNEFAEKGKIKAVIEALNTFLNEEVNTGQLSLQIEKTIGYALYPDDTSELEKLVSLSSLAMKAGAKLNPIQITKYDIRMSQILDKNFQIATRLKTAIENSAIEIHFQEVVDTETDKVIYLEELARWYDESLGWVGPEEFIDIAKESNLLDKLERFLIDKAVASFKEVKKLPKYKKTKLSLNIAPNSLLDLNFLYYLNGVVDKYRISRQDICIEISEGTFVNNLELCFARINQYKLSGYLIALDDFGKEYSSLAILENVAFDIIKIDALFTANIVNVRSQEIVKMIRKITKISNKDIVTEGVETQIQSDILKRLGCKIQQGYLHHRPEKIN